MNKLKKQHLMGAGKTAITITGSIGSGKSTVCNLLKNEINYELISGGSIFRQIAKEKGISVLDVNNLAEENESLDKAIDDYLISLNGKKGIIVDSRLAWYFIKNSFKVFLYVDFETAVERISKSKRETEGELIDKDKLYKNIKVRHKKEVERYKRLYGVNIDDYNNYDLVLNTAKMKPEEVVNIIILKIKQTPYVNPLIKTIKEYYNNYLDRIIICYESAARLHGMVSENGFPVVFFHNVPNLTSYINETEGVYLNELNFSDTVIRDGINYTNKERTICELIRDERDIQAILESIYDYNRLYGLDRLYSFAKKHNLRDEIKKYEYDALDFYKE